MAPFPDNDPLLLNNLHILSHDHIHYSTIQKSRVIFFFFFCSPRLHLFDQKYSKKLWKYYLCKQLLSIWI